ncbi:MAG: ABC transporter permease [Anaerolineales bacterium]|nr:ABC transporter permease [Anaerolineales bacterium]
MKLGKIFRTAWEGLMLNKARSFLTTLGVIIGVASVIVMLAVSAGAEASIADQINALGADLIIVSPMRGVPGAARTLLLEDAYAIQKQVTGITGISAEQTPPPQNVRAGGLTLEAIALVGTTSDFPHVRDYAVAEGRYFTADEDDRKAKLVVLGSGIAADLFGAESALGQTVTVGAVKLTVIGVMESKGIVSDVDYDGRIYLPLNLVFQKYMPAAMLRADAVRTIYLKAENQEKIPSVIAQTSALLVDRHKVDAAKPDFTVQTQQDIIATQEAATAAFRDLLAWVAGVSLLVG